MISKNDDGTYTVELFSKVETTTPRKVEAEIILDYPQGKVTIIDGIPYTCNPLRICGYVWADQHGRHSCQTWVSLGYYCNAHAEHVKQRIVHQHKIQDVEDRAVEALSKKHRDHYGDLTDEQYDSIFGDISDLEDII